MKAIDLSFYPYDNLRMTKFPKLTDEMENLLDWWADTNNNTKIKIYFFMIISFLNIVYNNINIRIPQVKLSKLQSKLYSIAFLISLINR